MTPIDILTLSRSIYTLVFVSLRFISSGKQRVQSDFISAFPLLNR